MEGEERAEVLNAFIAAIFNNKTSCSQGIQLPELEEVGGEQNEVPIIQREVSNLLCHLDTHRCDGIHPRAFKEMVEEVTESLLGVYQRSQLTGN